MRVKFISVALAFAVAGCAIVFTGCDKKDNPGDSGPQSISENNLFPFALNRKLVYNEVVLDAATNAAKPGSDRRHTIHVAGTKTMNGKTAYVMVDSVYANPVEVDTSYVAVENGNLYMDFEGSWLLVFDRSKGTETKYVIGNYILVDPTVGFPLAITLEGFIHNKADVSTPLGTFPSYRFDLIGKASLGGTTIEVPQYIWLSDGVGIVKLQVPVTTNPVTNMKEDGSEMLVVSKSF